MEALEAFIARWRASLEEQAKVVFVSGEPSGAERTFGDKANAFVESQGLKPIGFNWELLDPYAGPEEPRSAVGTIAEAFSAHMEYPKREWLGRTRAEEMANEFLALFDKQSATILSNRMGDLWNPLTDARIEWAFVGMDDQRIALLLATI